MTNIDVLMDEVIAEINGTKGTVLTAKVEGTGVVITCHDLFLGAIKEKLYKAFGQGLEVAAHIAEQHNLGPGGIPTDWHKKIAARIREHNSRVST